MSPNSATGTATTQASAVNFSPIGEDDDFVVAVTHAGGGNAEPDPIAEPGRHRLGQALVAAAHPPRLGSRHELRQLQRETGVDLGGGEGERTLQAHLQGPSCGLVPDRPLQQVEHGDVGILLGDARHPFRGRRQRSGIDARVGNQIAVRVVDLHAVELDPEPTAHLLGDLVPAGDELAAELDQGSIVEPGRPDPPADPLPRLQHGHCPARRGQLIRRRQPGEAGADHDGRTRTHAGDLYLKTRVVGPMSN